jgi:DNA-binding response OmpR family regulator
LADKKRILVADDADAVVTVLVTALEIEGYEVVAATNGNEAYDTAMSQEFDLAIIDQLMSGILGIDVLRKLRVAGNQLPVIILSGVDDDDIVVTSLKSGAIDFVRKPFRLPELGARIEKHLAIAPKSST